MFEKINVRKMLQKLAVQKIFIKCWKKMFPKNKCSKNTLSSVGKDI
jgi:hypothetical protein